MNSVMIADDEPEIHELLSPYLRREGYRVESVFSGQDAIARCYAAPPAAMLLDVMLPERDGFEVCRSVRGAFDFPILFLSARGQESDKVLGLGLGADDYVTKPFSPAEVVARVNAHIRRHQGLAQPVPRTQTDMLPAPKNIKVGGLLIDPAIARVWKRDGSHADLSAGELRLLMIFAQSPGRIFTKKQLYEAAWEAPYVGISENNTVMVAVRRLRERVEDAPEDPKYILTVRGLGYRMVAPDESD